VTELDRSSSPAEEPRAQTELERLTAIAQHQLNNPLAALLAEAQLLRNDAGLGEEQRAAVDRMIDLMRRINALVRDLDRTVRDRG
jgi:signal transduction histidine kinase